MSIYYTVDQSGKVTFNNSSMHILNNIVSDYLSGKNNERTLSAQLTEYQYSDDASVSVQESEYIECIFNELFKYNSLKSNVNRCIICKVDMGECNPRQYCCKTYCPYSTLDNK